MPYIIRPNGDADLTNATLHNETSLPQTITGLSAGMYDVGRIAWGPDPVTVSATPIPVPTVVQAPAVSGTGRIGEVQTGVDATWDMTPDEVESRWTANDVATGDTDSSYTPSAAEDGKALCFEQRTRKSGGTWSAWAHSTPVTVTQAAPVAAGRLADLKLTVGTAMTPVDVAVDFTGQDLTYALAPSSAALPAGLSLSPAGVLSGTPSVSASGLAIVVRGSNSGGSADSGFGLTVAAATGTGGFVRPTYSNTPSLAEVERLYTDRRLTRPDWWVDGTQPKQIGVDTLPAGCNYDAAANTITIPNGTTIDDLSGWDLGYTRLILYGEITTFSHNKIAVRPVSRADRVQNSSREPCLLMDALSGARPRVVNFHHNWFLGNGSFGPTALIQGRPRGSDFPKIDVMEWNSFEAFPNDGVKTTWSGVRRFNYFDPACNAPDDGEPWQSGKTYTSGAFVWDAANYYYRICKAASTTAAPDFSKKLAGTSDWAPHDPHSDTDTPFCTPANETAEFLGSFYNRDMNHRRYPSRQIHRGAVNAIRALPNNPSSQNIGDLFIHHNVFTADVEAANATDAITLPSLSDSYGTSSHLVENNWHEAGLSNQPGSHATVRNNNAGWTFPSAAVLSNVSASALGGSLAYGFTASGYGWMRVVVYASSGVRTAAELVSAQVGSGGVLAIFELDADPGVAMQKTVSLSLSQGQTVHVHGLFQSGGGTDTVAPVQTVSNIAGSGAVSVKDFSRDRTLFDVGYAVGLSGAAVPLSGTATSGMSIEARTVDETGGTSTWKQIATADGAGNWSGMLTVPQSPHWMRPEVRLAAAPATTATTKNRFGAGHLIALWQQSEDARMCDSHFSQTTPDQISDPEAVQVFWHDRKGTGASGVQHLHVTDATVASHKLASLAAMAASLIAAAPGHKFGILHHTQPGTDPREVANDSNTSRNWADDAAIHAYATADGAEVGLASHSWFAAPGSLHDSYAEALAPFYLGMNLAGTSVSAPTTVSYGNGNSYRMDHNLAELYKMPSRTKWLASYGAHRFDPVKTLSNSTTATDGRTEYNLRNKARATRSWRSALADPKLSSCFTAPVPAILSYETGVAAGTDWTDISHPSGEVDDGLPRRARYWALNWLHGLGISRWPMPVFDRCYREPSGAYIAVGSSAGPITTTRRARGLPALGKTFPHWTDVVGFEINGVPAQRAEIQPNGWVYIYPNSGSLQGATLTFAEGGATGMLQKPEDHVARLWMDYPIVDVGQGVVEGLPVQALPDPSVLLGNSGDPGVGDKTAPVLSGAMDTAAGAQAYAGSVSTNEGNGTLYWVATTSIKTPSDAQVRAGQDAAGQPAADAGSQPVVGAGLQTVAGTGLTAGVTHYLHFLHEDAAGNRSAVVSGDGFTTTLATDATPPALASPTDTETDATTASGTVDTDEATGTLHVVAVAAAGATPGAAQIEAGQDASGAVVPSVSQSVANAGTQTVTLTGLVPATSYKLAFMHKDAAGNRSTVAVGSGFTTPAAAGAGSFTTGGSGPYFADPANLGTNTGELTFEMRAERPASGSGVLFYQSATRINVDVQSSGAIRHAGLRDRTGTALISTTGSGGGAFPDDGAFHTVVTSISIPAGWVRSWVDGTLVVDTSFNASGSGTLDPNRFLICLATHRGSNQLACKVEHLKIWKAATATGDTSGLGTPYKAISGTAATVNADPWKKGADAT